MVTKLDVCDKVFIVGSNISKKQVQKRTGFRSPYDYLQKWGIAYGRADFESIMSMLQKRQIV